MSGSCGLSAPGNRQCMPWAAPLGMLMEKVEYDWKWRTLWVSGYSGPQATWSKNRSASGGNGLEANSTHLIAAVYLIVASLSTPSPIDNGIDCETNAAAALLQCCRHHTQLLHHLAPLRQCLPSATRAGTDQVAVCAGCAARSFENSSFPCFWQEGYPPSSTT